MYDGHSDPKQFLMSYEATISSYGGQYCSHGKVLRHGSQKRSSNLVLLSSARDNYVMAEAKGYVSDQLLGFSNEAGHCPGSLSVHAGPEGVFASVCSKVLAAESSSTYSAQ
jgi:hypothetical protein